MLCPHCSSPRHILCAAGFRVNVNFTTFTGNADAHLTAVADSKIQQHLIGPDAPAHTPSHIQGGTIKQDKRDVGILVALPAFSDTGLGEFGLSLFTARAPRRLKDGKLDTHFDFGQTEFVELPAVDGRRVNVLLVGLGELSECNKKGLCGLVGTAVDSAVSGLYSHLVIAASDLTGAHLYGQQLGAVARCRLSITVVEDDTDTVLSEMTIVVKEEQVAALCEGIDIPAPICASCNHPRAGIIKLEHPEPHGDGHN